MSEMKQPKWMQTGLAQVQKAREQQAAQFKPEFFLKEDGDSAKVIVLDKNTVNVMMHSYQLNGKFKKSVCTQESDCPICKVNEARNVCVYRVIDTREYKDKAGKTHVNMERYWEIGIKAMAQVESLVEDDNFYGKVIKVKRIGKGQKTAYAISFVGEPTKKYKPALDLIKDYTPRSMKELEMIAGMLGAKTDEEEEHVQKRAERYYDEDDDDKVEDEDEEAEEKPKTKKPKFASKKPPVTEDDPDADEDADTDDDSDSDADDDE